MLVSTLFVRASQSLLATFDQSITPLVQEGLGDPVLAAHITNTAIAAKAGQHDLCLFVWRPGTPLLLLAHVLSFEELERPASQTNQENETVNHQPGSASAPERHFLRETKVTS
jgi:hypothetical protein